MARLRRAPRIEFTYTPIESAPLAAELTTLQQTHERVSDIRDKLRFGPLTPAETENVEAFLQTIDKTTRRIHASDGEYGLARDSLVRARLAVGISLPSVVTRLTDRFSTERKTLRRAFKEGGPLAPSVQNRLDEIVQVYDKIVEIGKPYEVAVDSWRIEHYAALAPKRDNLGQDVNALIEQYAQATSAQELQQTTTHLLRATRTGWFFRSRLAKDMRRADAVAVHADLLAVRDELRDARAAPTKYFAERGSFVNTGRAMRERAHQFATTRVASTGTDDLEAALQAASSSALPSRASYFARAAAVAAAVAQDECRSAAHTYLVRAAEHTQAMAQAALQTIESPTSIGRIPAYVRTIGKRSDEITALLPRAERLVALKLIPAERTTAPLLAAQETAQRLGSYYRGLSSFADKLAQATSALKAGSAVSGIDELAALCGRYEREPLVRDAIGAYITLASARNDLEEATVTSACIRKGPFYLSEFIRDQLPSAPTDSHWLLASALRGDRGSSLSERLDAFLQGLSRLTSVPTAAEREYVRTLRRGIERTVAEGPLGEEARCDSRAKQSVRTVYSRIDSYVSAPAVLAA